MPAHTVPWTITRALRLAVVALVDMYADLRSLLLVMGALLDPVAAYIIRSLYRQFTKGSQLWPRRALSILSE